MQTATAARRQLATAMMILALGLSGCKHGDPTPVVNNPTPQVVQTGSSATVHIEGANRFPMTQSVSEQVVSTLDVTGSVNPDVSREIPVLSLANGRVVALHVGLGDFVHKGQLVMEVQSPDVSTAFDAYLKAVNDEHLASVTLERDKLLYDKGAIPQAQLQAAQGGDDDAKADLVAAEQQLKILGVDKSQITKSLSGAGGSETVKIYAPASGVVIAQNVTTAAAAGITYAGSTGSLTIADLSHVWVICDVYENDLAQVHLGQHVDIRLNAFPGKVFSGTVGDIGAVLDPNIRTAKVRIQVENPGGLLRIGMFATATILGQHADSVAAVPQNAVLQLHDHSYVFVPGSGDGNFQRVLITTGKVLDGNLIEVKSGIGVGQQVVASALDLQNTVDQQ